jgi:hypothetical protein
MTTFGSIAFVMAVAFSTLVDDVATTSESKWLTDYAAAREQSRQTGKPIFLVFR